MKQPLDDDIVSPKLRSAAARAPAEQSALRRVLRLPELGSLTGAIIVIVFFYALAPGMRHLGSASTILYQSSTLGIMAVGVALLMIGGEFDLSAGVAVITSALTAAMCAYQFGANVWTGIVIALLVSLGIGAFNGWMLVRTGLPSFLVTLGTFLMLQGANLAITRLVTGNVATNDVSSLPGFDSAHAIFASSLTFAGAEISISILWWLALVALGTWVLLRTRVGNWIFAAGGSAASARAVGVPTKSTKVGLFMAVGLCAWIAGMHQLFEYNTVQSGGGVGLELEYIVAAVVGGCLLTGGYGSIVGAALGALIFGVVSQGVVYAGWNPDWFKFFLGAMLLLATLVNMFVRRQVDRQPA